MSITIWMQLTALKAIEAIAREAADRATEAARDAFETEGGTPRFARLARESRRARALVSAYFD